MKKIVVIIVLGLLIPNLVFSQKSGIAGGTNKDRIILSVHNSFWQNLDAGVKQRTISPGFNAAILVDLPTSDDSPMSFGLGLGFTSFNLHSNAVTGLKLPERTTQMTIIPDGIKYSVNKLRFSYLNIPLELRLRTKGDFRFSIGLRSGLMIDAFSKYYGNDISGIDNPMKIIDKKISNTDKYLFEATTRIGWKWIALSGSYTLNSMYEKDRGPAIAPINVGLSFSLY
jgi:hypothetical protein